jgi:hypothetical protein
MDIVRRQHSGRFIIQGYGEKLADASYAATFVITEQQIDGDVEIKRSTGKTFEKEADAAESGLCDGIAWLEVFRPAN